MFGKVTEQTAMKSSAYICRHCFTNSWENEQTVLGGRPSNLFPSFQSVNQIRKLEETQLILFTICICRQLDTSTVR